MNKIRAIIIDDEAASLRSLNIEINKYCPDVEIVKLFRKPKEALSYLNSHVIDLVFLDIEMPQMNGFQLLDSVNDINFEIIFITSYNEFAVKAFEFNAVDYLLKPILKERLIESIHRIKQNRTLGISDNDLRALVNNIDRMHPDSNIENLAVPTINGFEFISISEIKYLEAEGNYTWVRLIDTQEYLISKSLKDVNRMIHSDKFIRIHKSYVVNIHHIKKYLKGRGGIIEFKDGKQIPVSRTYLKDLKLALGI